MSQIATFGTLGAKAVVRDAGRVLDMPYMFCDGLSKLIPFNPMDPGRWSARSRTSRPSSERYEQEEEVRGLVDLAAARGPDPQHRHARRRRADRPAS